MRLHEFAPTTAPTPDTNLVTALELLRHRYNDKNKPAKISTQSLINLVLNTDKTFDYSALVDANESNPAVKNIIKSFNKEFVILNPLNGESDSDDTTTNAPEQGQQGAFQAPVDDVSSMAKRAAKERGAAI